MKYWIVGMPTACRVLADTPDEAIAKAIRSGSVQAPPQMHQQIVTVVATDDVHHFTISPGVPTIAPIVHEW